MITKSDKVRDFVKAGDYDSALAIAHTFRALPKADRTALKRAHEVKHSAGFYAQLGKDPEALKAAGVKVLLQHYG